ncbi:MAG: class I SAM-dependent methyltransferase [Haliscomenobacter sp.]
MGLIEEFNSWQSGYTDKIRRWVPDYDQLVAAVVQALPVGFEPHTVLDLGCGNGNGSALLEASFPSASYTLLDASDEMLDACRERFPSKANFRFVPSYFQDARFPPAGFDLVIAVLALHHVPGEVKQAIFQQIYSWLRPGGVFLYSDLFATKQDPGYASTVLKDWYTWASEHGTSEEEWEYLMDHHEKYDFPDAAVPTLGWLASVGFEPAAFTWQAGYWGNIRAIKPS